VAKFATFVRNLFADRLLCEQDLVGVARVTLNFSQLSRQPSAIA